MTIENPSDNKTPNTKDQKAKTEGKRTNDKNVPSTSNPQHMKSGPTDAVAKGDLARQMHSPTDRRPGSSQAKNGPLSKGNNNTRE